jgi:hypothetical protein
MKAAAHTRLTAFIHMSLRHLPTRLFHHSLYFHTSTRIFKIVDPQASFCILAQLKEQSAKPSNFSLTWRHEIFMESAKWLLSNVRAAFNSLRKAQCGGQLAALNSELGAQTFDPGTARGAMLQQ